MSKIRALAGYPGRQQKTFAEDFRFNTKSWNHWEKGKSIPWQQASKLIDDLREVLPGLTMDYIYRNDRRGIPVDLARRLRD